MKHQLIDFLPTDPILYNPLLCTNSVQANYNDFQLPIQRPVEITNHEPPQLFAIRHLLQNQNISSQFRNPQLFQYIHAICHSSYSPLQFSTPAISITDDSVCTRKHTRANIRAHTYNAVRFASLTLYLESIKTCRYQADQCITTEVRGIDSVVRRYVKGPLLTRLSIHPIELIGGRSASVVPRRRRIKGLIRRRSSSVVVEEGLPLSFERRWQRMTSVGKTALFRATLLILLTCNNWPFSGPPILC